MTTKRGCAHKNVRPTSGKVRLALFNILNAADLTDGVRFLDLFSGTGEIAVCALAHGAHAVTAVESDARAVAAIASRMGDSEGARAHCGDVRRLLPRLARAARENAAHFDVIFADPPYGLGWGASLPVLMAAHWDLLAPRGAFVFERASREPVAEIEIPRDDRTYGETTLSFYWKGGGA